MAERLRCLRELVGLSHAELAEVAGIARPVVYALESGPRAKVTADVLVRLAETFGSTVPFLLYGRLGGRFCAFPGSTIALMAKYSDAQQRAQAITLASAAVEAMRRDPLPRLADSDSVRSTRRRS